MLIEIQKNGKTVSVIHNAPNRVSSTRLELLSKRYNAGMLSTWNEWASLRLRIIRAKFA